MTNTTRETQMVAISEKTILAICMIVDYLWEDERKHYECSEDDVCTTHAFNNLQEIRAWLDTVPRKPLPKPLMELTL